MNDVRELLSRLEGLQVKLWNEHGRLRFSAPQGVMTEALKSELRERKTELLAILDGRAASIPRIADQPSYPLSHAQWRMWVLSQIDEGSAAYNIPLHQLLEGPLDVDAVGRAFAQIAARHESLRTSIVMVDGEPRQRIHQQADAELQFIDLGDHEDPLEAARQLAQEHARRPFELEGGPLFRAALARLSENRHVLLFTIHHIVCDGVSIAILSHELTRCYEAVRRGERNPFPPLQLQYRDYADWQNKLMNSGALAVHRDWWLETLGDLPPALELPTDFLRPAVQTFEGRELSFHLPGERLDALRQLGRRHNASLFMTLLATLYVLLYRYTRQQDLVVGSPMAGRGHPELENQVGLYLNTIALRSQLDGTTPFADFLERVRRTTAAAFDHQSYPFDQLLSELNVARDLSRNPLFDVTMILQNQQDSGLVIDDVAVSSFVTHAGTSKTDLTFNFNETPSGLNLAIEFNTDLFAEDRIVRMGGHFCRLVEAVVDEPRTPIGKLNMLTVEETRELLDQFNATSRAYPADQTVVALFEQQVRGKPDAVAVQCNDSQATYRQLSDRVDRVAGHLRSLGVGRNVLVGVCLDRGIDMVAAVLAVMKAGGAYVPLDPSFPRERLAFMLADSQAPVLLTQQALVDGLPPSQARVVCLDADELAGAADRTELVHDADSERLAYVIYTSGSTGRPKGVAIGHRALVNFLCSMANEPGLTADDVLLAVTTLSFDIAALEIFLPLIQGAKLVLATRETAADGQRLLETLDRCGATVLQATPATWRMLLDAGWQASPRLTALCGGEALPAWLADQLRARCKSAWNMYGPTETTIWSTIGRLDADGPGPRDAIASIGRPIANTEIYILDQDLQPVPIGVPGDLYIGGDGLAVEYLNRPDLTGEKFLPHPFRPELGRRVYKTGDTARYQADGNLQFIGRTDQQIKLRGFRIELGEIESALESHAAVEQAVVDLRDDGAGDQRLAAWCRLCQGGTFSAAELRDHLKSKLPDYMIPTQLIPVPQFPLTPNGKVDRKALTLPERMESLGATYEPPRGKWERAIAAIWQDVLQVQRIGAHDDFFELGGHSLKATQVVSRMHRELSVEVSLREIFSHPTVAGLAETVADRQSSRFERIPKIPDAEHDRLSHGQRRLWVLSQMQDGLAAYNLPAAVLLEGQVDAAALQQALDAVVQRHDALRTAFVVVDGQPRSRVAPVVEVPIGRIDLSGHADPEREARRLALEDASQPFDLSVAGLLRVSLLKLAADRHVLLFNIHHVVSDQWSLDVLVREFSTVYNGGELEPLTIQYRDYAAWQNDYLSSEAARPHQEYWHEAFAGELPVLDLPTDFPRPKIKTFNGKTHARYLDREQTASLESFSRQRGASLFMTLVAAVKTLLFRYTGQEDLIVGFPIAGRNHADLESQIGFYVNTLPLRSRLRDDLPFDELLNQVRTTCTDAYEHQVYPFDRLVDELDLKRDVSRNPLFDVAVVMQQEQQDTSPLGALRASNFIGDYGGSKYDLHFAFDHHGGQLEIAIIYNTDLFRPERIERMSRHLTNVLAGVLEDAGRQLGALNILTGSERERLLSLNPGEGSFESPETLVQWFEARAAEQPGAIAVTCPEPAADPPAGPPDAPDQLAPQSLTYAELNARANQLAHFLRGLGVQPNVLVGLYVEASLDTVVSILGILKAGGAYVPFDTAHPVQRLKFVLDDAAVPVVVTRRELADRLPDSLGHVVCLDDDQPRIAACGTGNPAPRAGRDDLAYVIYTSGSTGQPKGVPVSHRNVTRLFAATDAWFQFNPSDVWTLFHSHAFDFSVWEIWGALLYGGRLVVVPHWISRTPEAFYDLLIDQRVTVLNQTPSAFGQLIRADGRRNPPPELALRLVIFGGEALDIASLRPWFDRHPDQRPQLVNMYGITETTVHVTYRPIRVEDTALAASRIGQAIPDLRLYLLDRRLNPVPIGVPGEICVGGPGVTSGYLNRPQLSSEKFVADPHRDKDAGRLYRSGDLGRYTEDGDIEYLGRLDDQIQIRGFRVETGEIAAALRDHPEVAEAVVVTQDFATGLRLVAYYVPTSQPAPDVSQLRQFLGERLPGYMVPAIFMSLAELPLTANNKLDRRALPMPDVPGPDERANFVAPRDDLEHVVAGVFAEVLQIEQVGARDNFFDLGGDSLLATQIVARLRDTFRADVSIVGLFTAQDVASLAELLRNKTPSNQADKIAGVVRRLQTMTDEEKQQLAAQGSR